MPWLVSRDHFEAWDRGMLHLTGEEVLLLVLKEEIEVVCAGIELLERETEIIMTSSKHYVNANKQFKGK